MKNSQAVCIPMQNLKSCTLTVYKNEQITQARIQFNVVQNQAINFTSLNLTLFAGDIENENLINQIDEDFGFYNYVFLKFIVGSNVQDSVENLKSFCDETLGFKFEIDDVIKQYIPYVDFHLKNIELALEFSRKFLMPLDAYGNPIDEDSNIPEEEKLRSKISFNLGELFFNTTGGFQFNYFGNINFSKSRILNSGFTLDINNLKLDLSRTSNIPEAIADGRPDDFIGAYITEGIIGFPAFWNHSEANSTAQLVTRNLLIGTGGISGTIGMEAISEGIPSPLIQANFGGGFNVSLDAFFIRFQQNAIIESTIHGSMQIPGFKDSTGEDAHINIDAWIGTNGEFSVTASEDQGITALKIPGVLDVRVDSLTVGRQNDRFYVAVAGAINFVAQDGFIGQFIPQAIEVQKLLIWQDGQMEFQGGCFTRTKTVSLNLFNQNKIAA